MGDNKINRVEDCDKLRVLGSVFGCLRLMRMAEPSEGQVQE
jgi:hypothetical protein